MGWGLNALGCQHCQVRVVRRWRRSFFYGGSTCVKRPGLEIGPAVRTDFRRLYPANAKMPTCCPSDDNRTKVTNSVTLARSLWWHVGPYFWPADLTRTANPIEKSYPLASWVSTIQHLLAYGELYLLAGPVDRKVCLPTVTVPHHSLLLWNHEFHVMFLM